MRLPEKDELENEDERYLYERDSDKYERFTDSERISTITRLVKKYSIGKKVLDAGAAQANISTLLAEEGFECVALDLNRNFLNYARKKREFGKISYVCANALDMPFKKNTFDVIILGEIVEHVAYPEKLLKETRRCLRKGGAVIITTPNNHLFSGMLSGYKPVSFGDADNNERKKLSKKQFGPSGSDHLYVFDIDSLQKLASEQGFVVLECGWLNSCFVNSKTYPVLNILPEFCLHIINKIMENLPFLRKNWSTSLYLIAIKK